MMRISTNTMFDSNVAGMGQQQSLMLRTQQQISTGQRILAASDDPAAAAQALVVSQSDAMNTQYTTNRNAAQTSLSLSESTLQSVTNLLQAVKSTAVDAGNGSYNNSDRASLATQLSGQLQDLIGLANSTDGAGNFLFSGFLSRTQPFANTPAGISYFGDSGQRNVQVSASRQVASSDSGADVFMRIKNGNGTFVTQAAAANTGSGIINSGSVLNPAAITGDSYAIAFGGLTAQAAVGNTGTGVISTPTVISQAAVTGNDYSVVFGAGGTTYSVTNTTTGLPVAGMTAQPYVSGQSIMFDGLQFNIKDGATPFAAGDTFTVTSPGYTVTDTTTATQVLPAPPTTGRVPYADGQAISFGGMQVAIQGTPASGDTFTVMPSMNESIFKTISDLIATLNTPVPGTVSSGSTSLTNNLNHALDSLNNALNKVLTTRSSLGSRLNEISALQATGDNLGLQYKQALSQLQDVDMTKAISDLTQQKMGLQAAQQSFAAVSNLSLFNYLK
jgi:flagellar hook-associated protein 3 FlgL